MFTLFSGALGLGSLAVTKYTEEEYVENEASRIKAKDALNSVANFDVLDVKTLTDKMNKLNALLSE